MDTIAYEELTGYRLYSQRDNWKSLCPIHSEKTPSFYIHKETYLCHCFGCGAKGYLDWLVARAYNMPVSEVRKELDIPLLKESSLKLEPHRIPTFDEVWLHGFRPIVTHPFLERRGFTQDTIKAFDARWDAQERRIVFPLRDTNGNTVGAVGRTTSVVEIDNPKWKFYWDTKPGKAVYVPHNYNMCGHIKYLVEGIFDGMWLYQHGYYNVGMLIRAIPTQTQIKAIKSSTSSITLFLDNDEAGRIGTKQLGKALKSSVQVNYIQFPEGRKDPQELTAEELDTAIRNRQTYVQYNNSR